MTVTFSTHMPSPPDRGQPCGRNGRSESKRGGGGEREKKRKMGGGSRGDESSVREKDYGSGYGSGYGAGISSAGEASASELDSDVDGSLYFGNTVASTMKNNGRRANQARNENGKEEEKDDDLERIRRRAEMEPSSSDGEQSDDTSGTSTGAGFSTGGGEADKDDDSEFYTSTTANDDSDEDSDGNSTLPGYRSAMAALGQDEDEDEDEDENASGGGVDSRDDDDDGEVADAEDAQTLSFGERLRRRRDSAAATAGGHRRSSRGVTTKRKTPNEWRSSASAADDDGGDNVDDAEAEAEAEADGDDEEKGGAAGRRNSGAKRPRRENKNRPAIQSSKYQVGRHREVVQTKKGAVRDPRFDSLCGKYNEDMFRKTYSFLDDYQDTEIDALKKSVAKEKDDEKRSAIQSMLTRLQQQRADRKRRDVNRAAATKRKRAERDAVAAGKKPFHLKRSEKKRLELEQRYEQLASEGKLEKFMEKRRKKNSKKDKRWLPTR